MLICNEHGHGIDETDENGRTALELAAARGYAECCDVLLHHSATIVPPADPYGWSSH